ncbi:hypothetical protein FQA39_LY13555 [Lamprigera yunnana]|nr:hypothetical protein FQA39_LY13555 [Lamprigera yunnana]
MFRVSTISIVLTMSMYVMSIITTSHFVLVLMENNFVVAVIEREAKCAKAINVIVEFVHGLPQVIVPLPSRKEKCKFTLRPISNTVGDFLEMLKKEDKGIDRAVIYSIDGTRIASSNTIETLLQDNFKLIINDNHYIVKTPEHHRITSDELKVFDDVKTVIGKLYETLHVEDFYVQKENDLNTQLEVLKQEIQPLEERRLQIEMAAEKKNNWLSWVGLGLMSIQFGILARLTWWEYSWDIMEPVTYFVTYGTAMAAYSYFVLTKEEYILQDVKNRQHLLTMHKKSKKLGLDVMKYNQLRDQISSIELELIKSKSKFRKSQIARKTLVNTNCFQDEVEIDHFKMLKPTHEQLGELTSELQESYITISDYLQNWIPLKHKHIVKCKKTDNVTWKQKDEAWEKIAIEYNSASIVRGQQSSYVPNTTILKKKFENSMSKSDKKFIKRDGNQYIIRDILKSLYERIYSLIKVSVQAMKQNSYNNDYVVICPEMRNLQRRDENVISSPLPIEICQTTDEIHLQLITLEDTTVVVEPSGSGESN